MIDWDRVSALRQEIGPEDFDEVIEIFLTEVDEEIDALSQTSPASGLEERLHYLKGSALNLGFRDFSDLCQSGESALSRDPGARVDVAAIQASYHASRAVFLSDLGTRFAR